MEVMNVSKESNLKKHMPQSAHLTEDGKRHI